MLWKSEDNANPGVPGPDQNGPTGIYAQSLSADGRSLLGQPVKILSPIQPWEGTIVEAPDMIEAWGTYWLFYSGNWFNQPDYGIGVTACQTPFGPCADVNPTPLLGSNLQGEGPGEASLFRDGSYGVPPLQPVQGQRSRTGRPPPRGHGRIGIHAPRSLSGRSLKFPSINPPIPSTVGSSELRVWGDDRGHREKMAETDPARDHRGGELHPAGNRPTRGGLRYRTRFAGWSPGR